MTAWAKNFGKKASQDTLVDSFADRINAVILKQVPEIADDPVLVQDLHCSTRAEWREFVASLSEDHRLVRPGQGSDLARTLARRGLDLGILLKVYWVAQQSVFQFLTEVIDGAGEDAPARDEILVFLWGLGGQWMADAVESLIETYYEERQRLRDDAVIRRAETIEALLGDAPPSADDATRLLGHPLSHWQTAYVVRAPEAGSSTTEAMLDVANAVAQALGTSRPLTMVAGSRDLWCWVATPHEPDLAQLPGLASALQQAGMQAAIGRPGPGIQGFRASHAEARAAENLALKAAHGRALVRYDEEELLVLVSAQETLMRRMVAREVGQLCGADKNLALLRETVLAYLTTLNIETTAERLFVHKNTVRYRIARAEELLGHPLSQRSTQVELALRWVSLFGAPSDTP
ncbi:helix-turn-helix domain-containing protein [Streptomyces sp. NBC_01474]|uniref:PucR family transcriptional regulator n=1 Tax=Streptomyces sp. NBC_01474 TaxID=2903880 RepID=UPI002DDB3B20|nr:helix-turn-helix domain-containing protein [Streptomyces sp. NBC_01474]WSD94721.1 helix-turn-helix domain-containing protein [Streptomyces sp. NBC_01474]